MPGNVTGRYALARLRESVPGGDTHECHQPPAVSGSVAIAEDSLEASVHFGDGSLDQTFGGSWRWEDPYIWVTTSDCGENPVLYLDGELTVIFEYGGLRYTAHYRR